MELVKDDNEDKFLALAGGNCKDKDLTLGTDSLAAVQVLSVAFVFMFVTNTWKENPDWKLLVFGAVCILMLLLFSLRSQQTSSLVEKERRDHKEKMANNLKEMQERKLKHRELELKHQQEMRERELKHREEMGGGDCQIL